MLCLPDTTFARGSEDNSREELAGASRCSGTLSSTRFSVNSSNHSGITASYEKDVGDEGAAQLEEPVSRPGTTIGT